MNTQKSLLMIATAFVLASCSSVSKVSKSSLDVAPSSYTSVGKLADDNLKTWPHESYSANLPGMNLGGAYDLLKKMKPKQKVIVGVIDSGIDINHEDLRNVVWTNPNEIANNGIDDDKNGYVDDIHGWNFLGDVNHENLEYVRIYKTKDKNNPLFEKAKKMYEKEHNETLEEKAYMEQLYQMILSADEVLAKELKKTNYTKSDLAQLKTSDDTIAQYVEFMQQMFNRVEDVNVLKSDFNNAAKYYDSKLKHHLNLNFHPRKTILKDDENDFSKKGYGNNNVIGPDLEESLHGTHVAGIIAAERGNGIGIDGVANNVQIMALRAVPDGDEYDKDIAFAIRYAADNGAKVINTSFGKGLSPHKDKVYEAIKYAASKDVLIVNAAGNDSKDIDIEDTYPNDEINGKEISDNFLTVGALNYMFNENLVASFSNFGKRNVDVFAPGVKIYAPAPDNNYKFLQGTSMASPEVAGIAALIRVYFPNLTAAQVKQVIMQSGVKPNLEVKVGEGENKKKVPFSELSTSGTIVNARNAIILAAKMSLRK
ncbi:S8 family peptidase [Capnocytophaga canis]|uniref:S8 family peptidase n=1 Tax=Capnocytophaga canis TaxID=1848903 RepID=UPI001562C78A|nr:S8 family peptidase [Capnocytophaga canis]